MSKIIKSVSVKIESPKTLGQDDAAPQSPGPHCITEFSPVTEYNQDDHSDAEGNSAVEDQAIQDIDAVKDQAAEILRETEQMVKELIQTARQEAEKIIGSANEEAGRLMDEAQARLKEVEEEAYQRGWLAGVEEGKRHAEEECRQQLEEARKIVEQAHDERKTIIAGSEDEIVQLAVAVAEKIVGCELSVKPEVIVDIVKKAINKTGDREELTVRVSPENLESALNSQEDIARSAKGIRKLKILADPGISPGGCVVETPNGNVDARVESQLSEIQQALMDVGPNA